MTIQTNTDDKHQRSCSRRHAIRVMFWLYGLWQGYFVGYNRSAFASIRKSILSFDASTADTAVLQDNNTATTTNTMEIVMFTFPNMTGSSVSGVAPNTSIIIDDDTTTRPRSVHVPRQKKRRQQLLRNATKVKAATKETITIQAIPLRKVTSPGTSPPKYGLSLVRCNRNVDWIGTIPPQDWGLAVFEKCGQTLNSNYSVHVQNGRGNEDLSAHMQYIATHYDNLPDYNIFMQDDGINGYQLKGRTCPHTPYHTLSELQTDLEQHLVHGNGFLNIGATKAMSEGLFSDPYHRNHTLPLMRLILDDEEIDRILPNYKNLTTAAPPPRVLFVHGSHWAVSKERILRLPRETYQQIHDYIMWKDGWEARRRACALERLIHVLFGEPLQIPRQAYVRTFRNHTEGCKS